MNPQDIKIQELTQRIALLEDIFFRMSKSDRMVFEKHLQMMDGKNIQLATGTGTMIGTGTNTGGPGLQKIGFFGTTPRVKYNIPFPVTAADLYAALNDTTGFGLFYHA